LFIALLLRLCVFTQEIDYKLSEISKRFKICTMVLYYSNFIV